MRIVVNKHGLVYLDFGRAGSKCISLQLYLTYHRLLHVRVAVNSHALPVHKKNRITSLLCIFETIILYNIFVGGGTELVLTDNGALCTKVTLCQPKYHNLK